MKLIFEKSKPGRRAAVVPKPDLPVPEIPEGLRRRRPPRLPELAEPEIVRHFTALADRTFGIDTGFYPLGSCTMKHNPRVNERVVALPGFRDLHPLQDEEGAQGALERRGNIDLDDLRAKVGPRTAGLMLTNPSTLGLFDENIEEIERIFHGAGALMYYDGANLNAVCGISRPGDMGFDVVHINLHKTFSQPHGGDGFGLDFDRPKSIGKVRAFTGPFGVFVRSYAFIRRYGPQLREMSETAVLNANYLLARLKDVYDLPFDRLCMHEFVLSARTLKRQHGITALDVAKRLMDYG